MNSAMWRKTVGWFDNDNSVLGYSYGQSSNNLTTAPPCNPIDTPSSFDCQFDDPAGGEPYASEAYISTGPPPFSPPLNWSLADKLTGLKANGGLDAVWYRIMLGVNLGWDLPSETRAWNWRLDPELAYDNLEFGYQGATSSGCYGNGSRTGILSSSQTLGQRLTVAQQNGRRITESEAKGILASVHKLGRDAKAASSSDDIQAQLASPLEAAITLLKRATPQPIGTPTDPDRVARFRRQRPRT